MSYVAKVYRPEGAEEQVVASGGKIRVESGGEIDVESGGALKSAGTAMDIASVAGVTAGTVTASKAAIVDANKDLGDFRNVGVAGAATHKAGAAAAGVAQRFGASATEGLEIKVIDETISNLTGGVNVDLTEDVPAGAVILSAQLNIQTLVVAAGTSAKVGLGTVADPDKYGITSGKTKNLKIDTIPEHAVLSGAEDVQVSMCATNGDVGDSAASAGAVRVRIVYAVPNSLDDAA